MKKIVLLLSTLMIGLCAQAQVTLTGTSYTQNFDGIGAGLPLGWEVDSVATAVTKGFPMAFDTTRTAWNATTGKSKNFAAKSTLPWNETIANQAAATNRALGLRQVGATDSQMAFTLQLANTTGFSNFNLSFKLMSLDSTSPRITTWKVEYAVGVMPVTFVAATTTGTLTTGGNTFSENAITANFGTGLNNMAGPIWIRITTNGKTTGAGNRASTGIDDFNLTYTGSTTFNPRPVISALNPSNNATNVAVGANLQITFNKPVTKGLAGLIVIRNQTDATQLIKSTSSADVTVSGSTATIANTGLVAGKTYWVGIDTNAFDSSGYRFAGIYDSTTWKFTTVPPPNYRPNIIVVSPLDNATSVSPGATSSLKMAFSRKVVKGTAGNVTIKNETDQTTQTKAVATTDVTLNATGDTATVLNVNLLAGKIYHVLIDSVAFDTAGYKVVGITDTTRWNFSTQGPVLTVTNLTESFEASCPTQLPAGWLQYSKEGPAQFWRCNTTAANYGLVMNGGGATSSTLNEDWLITPRIDPTNLTNMMLAFKTKYRFAGPEMEVKFSIGYSGTGDPSLAVWSNLAGITFSAADSNVWNTKTAAIPAVIPFFVAFKYTSTQSTPSNGREWSVDSVFVNGIPTGVATINSKASNMPVQVLGAASNGHVVVGFDLEAASTMLVAIYDLAGRAVYTSSVHAVKGNNKITLDPQGLQTGMYVIRITNGAKQGIARTFIQ